MKRLLLCVVALVGCVSPPAKPAQIGMTVDQYRLSCPLDGMVISRSADWVIGECNDKPDEYVEFRGGRIAVVMKQDEMFDRLADFRCQKAENKSACRAVVLQSAAEHVSRKASAGRTARQDELDRILSGISIGPAPAFNSSGVSASASGETCQLQGEQPAGGNKICYYRCIGSLSTISHNVSSVGLCPISINR